MSWQTKRTPAKPSLPKSVSKLTSLPARKTKKQTTKSSPPTARVRKPASRRRSRMPSKRLSVTLAVVAHLALPLVMARWVATHGLVAVPLMPMRCRTVAHLVVAKIHWAMAAASV